MKKKIKSINGYIEGYYGRLLTWSERNRIITCLKRNKMNFYFYAPKEDEKQRLNWKKKYDNLWKKNFKQFSEYAKLNQITIIAGISPGLDFDFIDFKEQALQNKISNDLRILLNKVLELLKFAEIEIGLLFDDLPNNFKDKHGNSISEGYIHAELANTLANLCKKNIFVVPRIYADELVDEDKNYLPDFGKTINKNNFTFYSGKYVVSDKISKTLIKKISKMINTQIIFWDNFYANDYCPRKLFIGPFVNRKGVNNLMINPTGLIETDLLILDIVSKTQNSKTPYKAWKKLLLKHDIPLNFFNVQNYMLKPAFGKNPNLPKINVTKTNIENLNYLLWKWKKPLSREWFPYLLGLKHDLQLNQKELSSERILKTQTKPLAKYLL